MKEKTKITPEIHFNSEFSFILISEVPVELREEFIKFMYSQTMPMVLDDHGIEYKDAVYSWDYINFLNKLFGRPYFID